MTTAQELKEVTLGTSIIKQQGVLKHRLRLGGGVIKDERTEIVTKVFNKIQNKGEFPTV
jgi:hypothetical protein